MTLAIKSESYILFHISKQLCGLPLTSVDQIFPYVSLSIPPQLPKFILGFMNVAQVAVPIISLERLFHLPSEKPGLYDHVISLKNSHRPMGFLVQKVREIRSFRSDEIRSVGEDMVFNRCAQHEVDNGGEIVHILNQEQLLLKAERERIAGHQEIEQKRMDGLNQK